MECNWLGTTMTPFARVVFGVVLMLSTADYIPGALGQSGHYTCDAEYMIRAPDGYCMMYESTTTCNVCCVSGGTGCQCLPGHYLSDRSENPFISDRNKKCKDCPAGQFQNDANLAYSCQPCNPGWYQNQPGNWRCKTCGPYEYMEGFGATACIEQPKCGQGQIYISGGDAATKSSCDDCVVGQYQTSRNHRNWKCNADDKCGPGSKYIWKRIAKGACQSCETGKFTNTTGYQDECSNHADHCSSAYYEAAPPTPTADRQCKALTPECLEGTYYETAAPTPTSDRQCNATRNCSASTFEARPPTITSDRICQNCTSGFFSNTTNLEACIPISTCSKGTYILTNATASSDVQCAPCRNETFTTQENSFRCQVWSTCELKEIATASGTASSDRKCMQCPAGYIKQNETSCEVTTTTTSTAKKSTSQEKTDPLLSTSPFHTVPRTVHTVPTTFGTVGHSRPSATVTTTTLSGPPMQTNTSEKGGNSSQKSSTGPIVGAIVAILVVVLCAVLVVLYRRKQRQSESKTLERNLYENPTSERVKGRSSNKRNNSHNAPVQNPAFAGAAYYTPDGAYEIPTYLPTDGKQSDQMADYYDNENTNTGGESEYVMPYYRGLDGHRTYGASGQPEDDLDIYEGEDGSNMQRYSETSPTKTYSGTNQPTTRDLDDDEDYGDIDI